MALRKRANTLTEEEEKRAQEIYDKSIVIECLTWGIPPFKNPNYLLETRDAGVTATHFTVPENHDHLHEALTKIAEWYEMAEQKGAIIAKVAEDIVRAKKEKRPCAIMGSQNGKIIEDDLRSIRILHTMGFRIIQLAHEEPNYIGTGGSGPDSGLTRFGRKVVDEMNRVGILIDVSHCGDRTVMDAIKYSQKPIAMTHTNPRAKVDHHRNKTDEQMIALAEKGGVIGLTAWSLFVTEKRGIRPRIEDFLDLMEYVINVVGVDHVGFGLDLAPQWDWDPHDYDQFAAHFPHLTTVAREERNVEELDDVSKIRNIAKGLLARGYEDNDISKILGGNFLNLFAEVWKK